MTLKTLTGPSIHDALADARRLFGDVVLLQSSPGGPGAPASVTVAFDDAPAPAARPPRAAPAVPEPAAPAAPRAYGYGAARQVRPSAAEPFSPPTPLPPVPLAMHLGAAEMSPASAEPIPDDPPPLAAPEPTAPAVPAPPPIATPTPAASAAADEVAALRARLAELEATLQEVRDRTPPPVPNRPPLVLVGRAGSGKTTLALRLAQSPGLTGAASPAVLVVAPEDGPFLDPAPSFWDAGVPVAVVRSADDVAEAMRTFADADLLLVDTPALPLRPELARPAVARLGTLLAPLAAVDVALAVDVSRATETLTAASLGALGLQPDALALTRLDEAACAAAAWERHLRLPARFVSTGPGLSDLASQSDVVPPPPPPPPALAAFASATSAEPDFTPTAGAPTPSTPPRSAPTASGERRAAPDFETLADLLAEPTGAATSLPVFA